MGSGALVNIGEQRFDRIREQDSFYIDKTGFISEWWEYGSTVTLITRPRRFGKTLNMSMLECFFSNQYADRGDLFQNLFIWEEKNLAGEYKYRQLQGTFPVIFISFAPIKTGNPEEMRTAVKQIITNLYVKFKDIMESKLFDDGDRKAFADVNREMDDVTAYTAINSLCIYLSKYYGKDVIVLLDEYDTPMQESWMAGTWDETVDFFRNFFNYTFKTNPHLYRGLITGILVKPEVVPSPLGSKIPHQVDEAGLTAKFENTSLSIQCQRIFSDLNNLKVVTTTSDRYATSFGFTEEEVFRALEDAGLGEEMQGVKKWYDGFTFGSHKDIYNPWSIASFIENDGKYDAYWANTSGNSLVNSLIQRGNSEIKQTMEELLQGRSFVAEIDEQIVFQRLSISVNAVWSLLLATGYLKVEKLEYVGTRKRAVYTLALTNMEVENMFEDMVKAWFKDNAGIPYNDFVKALLIHDVDAMNEFMNDIAFYSLSNFDVAKSASSKDAPERFYHGFVLGLIVELSGRFQITSNRESGFGRYDIMLTPVDRKRDDAYIIEFKVHKPLKEKDLEETVANALAQIEEKQYEAQLISNGIAPEHIRKYGFAFQGKTCLIG